MWFRLDLDGIVLNLQIKGYVKTAREDWDSVWCSVDFSFVSEPWLNYSKLDAEIFLASEIDDLIEAFDALLMDRITEQQEFTCIEPDFTFILNPKEDVRDNPRVLYVRPGSDTIIDASVEWQVSFWNGYLTANFLSLTLDRKDIEYFLTYLRLVAGRIAKDDPAVVELMQKDILYEMY